MYIHVHSYTHTYFNEIILNIYMYSFHFSTTEVLCAAEQQLESADGLEDTLFTTFKVTLDEEGKLLVDAWQICKQGLSMVAEGALTVSPNPGVAAIHPTFTAYVELRPTKEVDNHFFITRVPIKSIESLFISTFPRLNRPEIVQSTEHIKKQLSRLGKEGWSMKDLISDFHFLLFLCNFMDMKQVNSCVCNDNQIMELFYALFLIICVVIDERLCFVSGD